MAIETLVAQITPEAPFASRRETALLPVCCVCRLIRDETSSSLHGEHWVTQRTYQQTHGVNPTDCLLTHTYCPECFTQVMDRMRAAQVTETLTVASREVQFSHHIQENTMRHAWISRVGMVTLIGVMVLSEGHLSTAAPNGIEPSATEAVKSTVIDLKHVLNDDDLKQPEQAKERRHEIEEIIKHRVDYEEMAKRALGAPWPTLSPRDQHEFVDLFVQLLRDAFAGRITERFDEQVIFLGEFRENAFAEVRAQLNGRKINTPIDFRLIHRAHEWRVYDVIIDGASIVSNYRAQFTSIIRDVTYVGLVKKMEQKAVTAKGFEQFPVP